MCGDGGVYCLSVRLRLHVRLRVRVRLRLHVRLRVRVRLWRRLRVWRLSGCRFATTHHLSLMQSLQSSGGLFFFRRRRSPRLHARARSSSGSFALFLPF